MTEWMLAHPWLTFFGWWWAWFFFWMGMPPLVSVRPYTPLENQRLRAQVKPEGGDRNA